MNANSFLKLWVPAVAVAFAAGAAHAQRGPQREAEPVKAVKLASNVYMLAGGSGANASFLAGDDGVLLVDTKTDAASGEGIVNAIKGVSDGSVRFLVNTHEHPDHVGNNALFAKQGAVIIAHEGVRTVLSQGQRGGPPAPKEALPVVTFGDGAKLTIHFDGETVEVMHMPAAHTKTNTMVRYVNANVYHLGDLYRTKGYPVIAGGTIQGFIDSVDMVLKMSNDDSKFIPGVGDVGSRADLEAFRTMLVTVRDRVAQLVKEGKTLEEVVAAKPTAEFDATWGAPSRLFVPAIYREMKGGG
jgi:glyoxylase-like metal-dependent hydrolase (beta-lactamase superfamily II)